MPLIVQYASSFPHLFFAFLQGDRMDREAMNCKLLTVSNHSCESLTVVGNTLKCTVPPELQNKELEVEVRNSCTEQTPEDTHLCSLQQSVHKHFCWEDLLFIESRRYSKHTSTPKPPVCTRTSSSWRQRC